jgi:tRNA(adenine34) deaminase
MVANDLFWMQQAYNKALEAEQNGEIPIGAVIIDSKNNLLAEAGNRTIIDHDPTLHAEIVAIRQASKNAKNHRLVNTTIYVTLEPCVMCMGAILQARIKRLVFAARDFKCGAAGTVYNLHNCQHQNHKCIVDEGIMQTDCATLLKNFFNIKRN